MTALVHISANLGTLMPYTNIISSVYQQINEFVKRTLVHVAWVRRLQALCPVTNRAV